MAFIWARASMLCVLRSCCWWVSSSRSMRSYCVRPSCSAAVASGLTDAAAWRAALTRLKWSAKNPMGLFLVSVAFAHPALMAGRGFAWPQWPALVGVGSDEGHVFEQAGGAEVFDHVAVVRGLEVVDAVLRRVVHHVAAAAAVPGG